MGSVKFGDLAMPDDEMLLATYQKDIKLEAIARRAPSKNGSRSKKGQQTPPPLNPLFSSFLHE